MASPMETTPTEISATNPEMKSETCAMDLSASATSIDTNLCSDDPSSATDSLSALNDTKEKNISTTENIIPLSQEKTMSTTRSGRHYKPINLGDMKQVEQVNLYEDFSTPAQLRKAYWIASLTTKQIKGFWHKTDKDAETLIKAWNRFIGDRLSNHKKSDYKHEGIEEGDKNCIYYLRSYNHSSTSNGCPGRLYCHTSLQSLARPMRNLLIEDVCSDIDMCNAAPTILCWLAKMYQLNYLQLKSYRDNRKSWFHQASMDYGWTKRYCKDFVIRHMFNAKPDDRIKNKEFKGLVNEIYQIKKALYKIPELSWVLQYCTHENPLGTFLKTIIFAIEAKLTSECVKYAQSELKWKIQCIVHDGFNPFGKFTNENDKEPLEDFEHICEQLCPGIELKWAWKEFDLNFYDKKTGELLPDLNDPERRPREFRPPPDWQPPEDDPDAEEDYKSDEDDFEGDADFEPSYNVKKRLVEEYLWKVSDLYVDIKTDKQGKLNMISRTVMNDRFEELNYSHKIKDKETKQWVRKNEQFLPKWRKDPHIRKYTRMVCDPTNSHDAEDELNTWMGYDVDKINKDHDWTRGKELVLQYLRFQKYLFHSKRQVEFGLDWQSHIFALPEEKPGIMACLLGEQGGGKSTWFEVITLMIGAILVMVSGRPENDFYGPNGTICIANKKFLNCQECSSDAMKKHADGLKPVITDRVIRCKGMCKDPIPVDSIHAVGLSSNHLDAPPDSDKERRYWAPLCTTMWAEYKDPEKRIPWSSPKEKADFFAKLNNDLITDPDFQIHYAMFLRARAYNEDGDLRLPKRFSIEHVPIGKLQKTIRANNKQWIDMFLYDLISDWDNVEKDGWIDYTVEELNCKLTKFSEKQKWEDNKNERNLTTKLSYLKLSWAGIRGGGEEHRKWDNEKHKNVNYWSFDLEYMRNRLKINVKNDRIRKFFNETINGLQHKLDCMAAPYFQGLHSKTTEAQEAAKRYKVERTLLEDEKLSIEKEKNEFEESMRHVHDETEEDWDYVAEYEHYMGARYRQNVPTTVDIKLILKVCIGFKRLGKRRHIRKLNEKLEKERRVEERRRQREEEERIAKEEIDRKVEEVQKRQAEKEKEANAERKRMMEAFPPDPTSKCKRRRLGGNDICLGMKFAKTCNCSMGSDRGQCEQFD